MMKKSLQGLIENNSVSYCIMRFVSRLLHRDQSFIHDVIMWDKDPDRLKLVHLGEDNDNCIVYIINEQGHGYGFFSEFRCLLEELFFADTLGLKPYVVFGEKYLYYEKEGVEGEYNAFNYYFELNDKINNPFSSRNVVYSMSCHAEFVSRQYSGLIYDSADECEDQLAEVLKKYINIKESLLEDFEKDIHNMFGDQRVIGVHYRGTDFKQGYDKHPKEVKIEQITECIRDALKDNKFQSVFLATDEKSMVSNLKDEFGDKIKYFNDVYRGESAVSVALSESDRDKHHYLLGLEVLRDVYTLSKCNGLIAGISKVSICAKIMKKSRDEKYDYLKIINNGINKSRKGFKANSAS